MAKAFALLERVGVLDQADKRADALSGGQRQRVGVARALEQDPELLLIDEPTASLDPKTSRQIMRLIREICAERNLPAIINIHDVLLAQDFVDRIVGLRNGEVVFDGPPSALSPEVLTRIYGEEDWAALQRGQEREEESGAGDRKSSMANSNAAPALPETHERVISAMARAWRRPPLIRNRSLRWALAVGASIYLTVAITSLEINWASLSRAGARLAFRSRVSRAEFRQSLGRYCDRPAGKPDHDVHLDGGRHLDLAADRHRRRAQPSAAAGLLLCRGVIALSRSLQEIIVAIFFVAMFGFGPFAGFLTLSFATIGFLSKLLAEDIEDVDESQAEAIRATGAGWWQLVNYAIQPQVMPRLIGLSWYRLDINFRESAVIGIVGAGGIGATLNTTMDRYEYDSAGAILLLIIAIVMAAEYLSGYVRKWVQ